MEPAHKPVVGAADQLFLLVRDADNRELWQVVEVVNGTGVFQPVNLVEDDDRSRAVVLLEPVDEFGVRRLLPVEVQYRAFSSGSPAETHMDRPRIRSDHLVRELGLDLPAGERECQHDGCEKLGETYWIPPARLYGIDNLYCPEHAEHAAENFELPTSIEVPDP